MAKLASGLLQQGACYSISAVVVKEFRGNVVLHGTVSTLISPIYTDEFEEIEESDTFASADPSFTKANLLSHIVSSAGTWPRCPSKRCFNKNVCNFSYVFSALFLPYREIISSHFCNVSHY